MRTFKFRAECLHDVFEFLKEQAEYDRNEGHPIITSYKIISMNTLFPDVALEFQSLQDISVIRDILSKIQDGHVMLESVNTLEEYTGERYHDETMSN